MESDLNLERCVALAEASEAALFGRGQGEALDLLESEHENLLRALDEACHQNRASGVRIGIAVWRFWLLRGHLAEGRERLARLLDDETEVPARLYHRGVVVLGVIAFFQGDHDFARQCALSSLTAAIRQSDEWAVAFSLTILGWAAQSRSDYSEAHTLFQEALELFACMGHRWGEAVSLLNLGEIARSRGQWDDAQKFYLQDLGIYRELEESSAIAATLCNLGYVALHQADFDVARRYFEETLSICERVGNKQFVPGCLIGLGGVAASEGRWEKAARLIGEADALLSDLGSALEPADIVERERISTAIRQALGEARFETLLRESANYSSRTTQPTSY